ncbi:2,3-bisphosphoglycerate-independent phosphoglycerate mutase [Peptoniphilus sp. KCTC 25270]|uniref:2,3-bisphosphoglycerate-independent phosphoglycerate mutase n=1 Tax=Peptoniphilus sp. KCTC 25270 TaxID=2897414 RepID=UPI001E512919|nr:2,3-bisphosphoglycerate-independent phosphoglycerate mutase [Peptoniphilus sp. KCTC 25270]MCD1147399.1 2,3-bisphosphoglycerate-independent phosphoglycerate mutase [Peptoniphilus sp. KCTC 25270]
MNKPVALIILDGLGLAESGPNNAFALAETPVMDALKKRGMSQLIASGESVGLPEGQMGNSEVGHLNIGAGRIVDQELNRISKVVAQDKLKEISVLTDLYEKAKEGHALHLMGLLSDGGVHSHRDHLYGLLKLAHEMGIEKVYVHGIADGRDVAPMSVLEEVKKLQEFMKELGTGKLATIIGRYYAMDRDKRWERTQIAYDLFSYGVGIPTEDAVENIQGQYDLGITDEFLKPMVLLEEGKPLGTVEDEDVMIFYNFRPDRARQITRAFVDSEFSGFPRYGNRHIFMGTMTEYDKTIPNTNIIFEKEDLSNGLGEVISKAGLKQLRIAETEKYPHVTFFFNGGREEPFEGEERILVPSPKVSTYDLAPEMSAYEVTEKLLERLDQKDLDFVALNFANPDMVGHTGVLSAAIQAVETVDICLGKILEKLEELGGAAIITSDHGNCEVMAEADGTPRTSHTTNPVPLFTFGVEGTLVNGILADLAPTILELLEIEKPITMAGTSLIHKEKL